MDITLKYFIIVSIFLMISCNTSDNSAEIFNVQNAQKLEKEGWDSMPKILSRIIPPKFPNATFNIKDYGAIGDSLTNDLKAIIVTINACAKAGGGTVLIPSGNYFMKGPIHLKSNVNLKLNEGARLFFSQNSKDYLPAVKVRWEGTVCYNYSPLIYGYQLKNIAITGKGVIDGAAGQWARKWKKLQEPDKVVLRQMGNDTIPDFQRVFANGFLDLNEDGNDDGFGDGEQHYLRPTLIEFYECENIVLEDLTVKNSPFWTVHPVFSKNTVIRNLSIYGNAPNNDGIDPDSCENMLIEGCQIQTQDDAISIKAGRDQDAWNRRGSKNIIVRNNQLLSNTNALCIGSEMSGGVSYVFAENNYIGNSSNALNFKCNLDRGGQVEKIFIRNTEIDSLSKAMFVFQMDYHGYRGNNFPTKFNDFYISGITCTKVEKMPFKIIGVSEQHIQRIYLDDIHVEQAGEESQFEYVDDLIFNDLSIPGRQVYNE